MPTLGHSRSGGRLETDGAVVGRAMGDMDLPDAIPFHHLVAVQVL